MWPFKKKVMSADDPRMKAVKESVDALVIGITKVIGEMNKSINANIDSKFLALDHKMNNGTIFKAEESKEVPKASDTYVSDLMYAKDKFAETPHEKAIITKIINKIKQKHASTNTTS